MRDSGTSVFANGLIWFGAAVSIAEILTGTLLAPLGFEKGLTAVLLGHLIGCALLYGAGLIGGRAGLSAMETVKLSFGQQGSLLFSSLNVLQLVGWTAVMIASGAAAAQSVAAFSGGWIWCAVIGGLIALWVLIGIKNLSALNVIAMTALFVLTVVLSVTVFKGTPAVPAGGGMSFGSAVELSAAMPLSWLPLVSDYTRAARKPRAAAFASAAVYFAVSCWMYVIGMGAALYTGESDVAKIMVSAGLGISALVIVIFSTVTTTFLDVYSAGVSCGSISASLREKPMALLACAAGTALAIFAPVSRFEEFLYLIGSVFAPMIAIQLADAFALHADHSAERVCAKNLIIWAAGFALYRALMNFDTPAGITLPVMLITAAASVACGKFKTVRKAVGQ